jgi:hypothetical protein
LQRFHGIQIQALRQLHFAQGFGDFLVRVFQLNGRLNELLDLLNRVARSSPNAQAHHISGSDAAKPHTVYCRIEPPRGFADVLGSRSQKPRCAASAAFASAVGY